MATIYSIKKFNNNNLNNSNNKGSINPKNNHSRSKPYSTIKQLQVLLLLIIKIVNNVWVVVSKMNVKTAEVIKKRESRVILQIRNPKNLKKFINLK